MLNLGIVDTLMLSEKGNHSSARSPQVQWDYGLVSQCLVHGSGCEVLLTGSVHGSCFLEVFVL